MQKAASSIVDVLLMAIGNMTGEVWARDARAHLQDMRRVLSKLHISLQKRQDTHNQQQQQRTRVAQIKQTPRVEPLNHSAIVQQPECRLWDFDTQIVLVIQLGKAFARLVESAAELAKDIRV